MAEKPILFNTEMVRAILDGRKTQTRRVCKGQPQDGVVTNPEMLGYKPPYRPGDILWVRETWCRWWMPHGEWHYCYKASNPNGNKRPTGPEYDDDWETCSWRPSIHMPREAARLFLRVNRVWMERLQEIMDTPPGPDNPIVKEGCTYGFEFIAVWDKTIKPAERPLYGWVANPWVWVIEFERLDEKPAGLWADRDAAQYADQDVLMPAT